MGRGRLLKGIYKEDTTINVDETNDIYLSPLYIFIKPHPVKKKMTVILYDLKYYKNGNISCRIYDMNGFFMKDISYEAKLNNNGKTSEFEVDVDGLIPGVYFIQFECGKYIRSKKFMIVE